MSKEEKLYDIIWENLSLDEIKIILSIAFNGINLDNHPDIEKELLSKKCITKKPKTNITTQNIKF